MRSINTNCHCEESRTPLLLRDDVAISGKSKAYLIVRLPRLFEPRNDNPVGLF
jgi:hypothetical protein